MKKERAKSFHRNIFWGLAGVVFLMLLAYNSLTPYLSDDIFYAAQVREARSLWDLMKQQYAEYISNSGRIIGQFNIRLSLIGSKMIFNIVNSFLFVVLTLLIYKNIPARKKYDTLLYILIVGMLWKYSVEFGQTILWICGACNYLWGSVIILGFITFYRHTLDSYAKSKKHPLLMMAGTGLFGVAAGWCNENTSGGGLLLVLIFGVLFYCKHKKIYGFMVTGPIGMMCGIIGMITAPGVASRSSAMTENFTGAVGLLSRIYKITLDIRDLFWPLLTIFILVTAILTVRGKINCFYKHEPFIFMLVAIVTAYALMLAPTPEDRAFFGAGIFMIIACVQGIMALPKEDYVKAAQYSFVGLLTLWLMFTYLDNLVNLARIYREENERVGIISAAKAAGETEVTVPQFREAFRNPYSVAHDSDMTEEGGYWINTFYEAYYGVEWITAIPREEWNNR